MNILKRLRAIKISAALIMGNRDLPSEKKAQLLYDEIQQLPVGMLKRNKKRKKETKNAEK